MPQRIDAFCKKNGPDWTQPGPLTAIYEQALSRQKEILVAGEL